MKLSVKTWINSIAAYASKLVDIVIDDYLNRFLYRVCPRVAPYSEWALNHIGTQEVRVTDRHAAYIVRNCDVWHRYSVAFKYYVIRETVKTPDRTEYIYGNLKKYPLVNIGGRVTTIGDLWPENYYHKYIDMIPKLYGLHTKELVGLSMTLVLDDRFNEEDLSVVRALVPENVEIRVVSSMRRIHCEKYIHLPRLSVPPDRPEKNLSGLGYLPREYVNFYRGKLSQTLGISFDAGDANRRIFISRRNAARRRMLNEDEILPILEKRGFECIVAENLNLEDQIRLFASTSVVVCQHGAGLTNLLYVPKGTKVVEIFASESAMTHHFSSGIDLLGLDYASLSMTPVEGSGKDADGTLDPGSLESVLRGLE